MNRRYRTIRDLTVGFAGSAQVVGGLAEDNLGIVPGGALILALLLALNIAEAQKRPLHALVRVNVPEGSQLDERELANRITSTIHNVEVNVRMERDR